MNKIYSHKRTIIIFMGVTRQNDFVGLVSNTFKKLTIIMR